MIHKYFGKPQMQIVGFFSFLIMMCVLKLWFTLFAFFILAIFLTFFLRRRFFCQSICPLGAVQDFAGSSSKKTWNLNNTIKKIFIIAVWLIWVFIVELNYRQPTFIWFQLLRISLLFVMTAILLQFLFKKRTWCLTLCPMAPILRTVSRIKKSSS